MADDEKTKKTSINIVKSIPTGSFNLTLYTRSHGENVPSALGTGNNHKLLTTNGWGGGGETEKNELILLPVG